MTLLLNRSLVVAWSLFLLVLLPVSAKAPTDRTADQILGRWLFPGRGSSVEVYRAGDRYFGRIAEVSPAGKKEYGLTKNQLLFTDLMFDGSGWSGGQLIHPKTGNSFDVEIEMRDSRTLRAVVYKGWRLLHKEFVLTRQNPL
ncbi:DUF2147 domain-containing protein [Spirosoma soli]|uniref:DUF2147 domain-containing protein n=1 Tax=Spirosoma soli TaxID=1770529 RepID=A0ABW5LZ05_9BACT